MAIPKPSEPPLPLRAKPLPRRIPEPVQLRHIQSSTREPCRRRSRELVDVAMRESRASVADIAEALDVDTRAAGRALTGEKPIDLGDVIAIVRARGRSDSPEESSSSSETSWTALKLILFTPEGGHMSISPAIPADQSPAQSPVQSPDPNAPARRDATEGPLRVYVAGASREPERVRAVMRELQAAPNVIVTHDWLTEMERRPEDTMLRHELVEAARADIRGMLAADVLLFLLPAEPSPGAWFELGFFARRWLMSRDGGHIIVSGDAPDTLFTSWLHDVGADRVSPDSRAIGRITRMAIRGSLRGAQ